jgi:hypothetical protein
MHFRATMVSRRSCRTAYRLHRTIAGCAQIRIEIMEAQRSNERQLRTHFTNNTALTQPKKRKTSPQSRHDATITDQVCTPL